MILNIENTLVDTEKIFAISPISKNNDDFYFEINNNIIIRISTSNELLRDPTLFPTIGDQRKKCKELINKLRDRVIYYWNKDKKSKIIEINFKSIQENE